MSRFTLGLTVVAVVLATALPALGGAMEDAEKAVSEKRWADAVAAFREVLDENATHRAAAVGLARAAIEGGLVDVWREAEQVLLDLPEAEAARRDVRLALGDLYLALAAWSTDDQEKRFTYEDAKSHFEALLEANPDDEDAVVGLARTRYETADFDGALGALNAFLERAESQGPAQFWKGQVLYLLAQDAYRKSGAIEGETRSLFTLARDAYQAAVAADPTSFLAALQLAYTAQYLGEREQAREAYVTAMDLDHQSDLPLRGIEALFSYDQAAYGQLLQELAREHPDNAPVYFYLGYHRLAHQVYEGAVQAFRTYIEKAADPGVVWTYLGQAYAGSGDDRRAVEAWEKALEANPDDDAAAGAWDAHLRGKMGEAALGAPADAQRFARAYDALFQAAPNNPWVRNNVAFVLREAVDRRRGGQFGEVPAAWRPVLTTCIEQYEAASQAVESRTQAQGNLPYATRHAYAGILNDTGLMFQYYPSTRDHQRAEDYYLRALGQTEDGYRDAFTNLERLYSAEARWQDLYDLAVACAESLKNEDGSPDQTARSLARGVMERMRRDHGIGD
jgi:tetratricopeptide (TPR) repeat protein